MYREAPATIKARLSHPQSVLLKNLDLLEPNHGKVALLYRSEWSLGSFYLISRVKRGGLIIKIPQLAKAKILPFKFNCDILRTD